MKRIITYGTFDLLHYGHINLLKRAKALGDYLIVGITSDLYDKERGKLNIRQSLAERIENVKGTGLADEIIVEEYEGQKILDIKKYQADVFVIGSDWTGKFDYLKDVCEVVYLERTRGISSTRLREKEGGVVRLGVIGSGRIASRFVAESKFVSGVNVEGVYNPHPESARNFAEKHQLNFHSDNLKEFFAMTDAVYIASPHTSHFGYIVDSLMNGRHVLCEKPMCLSMEECRKAFELAIENGLVLQEAVKTAYSPAFEHLAVLAKSGRIGEIKDVEASFTKLIQDKQDRALNPALGGGSMNELASYVLLAIVKLLGTEVDETRFYPSVENGVDVFTRGLLKYRKATASFKVGLGAKTEGDMVVTGTKGYIYVPAPWWKTEYFEIRFEDFRETRKYFYKFDGDGLRYEIADFINNIFNKNRESRFLSQEESVFMAGIIEDFGRIPEISTMQIKKGLNKK